MNNKKKPSRGKSSKGEKVFQIETKKDIDNLYAMQNYATEKLFKALIKIYNNNKN
jgi:hypothetical protein